MVQLNLGECSFCNHWWFCFWFKIALRACLVIRQTDWALKHCFVQIDWPWWPWLPGGLDLNSSCSASCTSWPVANSFTHVFCTYSVLASFSKPFYLMHQERAAGWVNLRGFLCRCMSDLQIIPLQNLQPSSNSAVSRLFDLVFKWGTICLNNYWGVGPRNNFSIGQ